MILEQENSICESYLLAIFPPPLPSGSVVYKMRFKSLFFNVVFEKPLT